MLNQQAPDCRTHGCPDTNDSRKRSRSDVEAACPLRAVFDNEDRDNTEDGVRYPVERLDGDQRSRSVCKGVEDSAYRKNTEAEEQEGFSSLRRSPFSQ